MIILRSRRSNQQIFYIWKDLSIILFMLKVTSHTSATLCERKIDAIRTVNLLKNFMFPFVVFS